MLEPERAWADQEEQRPEEAPASADPVAPVPVLARVWAAQMGSVLVVVQPSGAPMGQVLVWAPALAAPVASMPGPGSTSEDRAGAVRVEALCQEVQVVFARAGASLLGA